MQYSLVHHALISTEYIAQCIKLEPNLNFLNGSGCWGRLAKELRSGQFSLMEFRALTTHVS